MKIIIKNYLKNLFNEKAHYIFIGFPLIISFCVGLTLKGKMFETFGDTKSRIFAIVCVSIWIGLFNSVLEICKERETIKSDLKSGFNALELYISRFLVQFVVCLVQSIIIFAICTVFVDFPEKGFIFNNCVMEVIISIFLTALSADVMGLFISSICGSNDIANRSLPFILMVQFIFSGQLFELGDSLDKISNLTISKWSMEALGSVVDLTSYNSSIPIPKSDLDAYEFLFSHVTKLWGILILFTIVFSLLSVYFINRIKHSRK